MSLILDLLSSKNYQTYNRELARKLGSVHAAIFLCELANRENYHGNLTIEREGKKWFFYTHEKGVERLCLSRKEQDSAIKILIKLNLIEKKVFGLPALRHFSLNSKEIEKFMENKKKSASLTETDKPGCPKGTNHSDRNGQTLPIYKNTSKNTIKEREGETPKPPVPASKKIDRLENVKTTAEEHRKLVDEFGEIKVSACYDILKEWKIDTVKSKWKKCDYRSILRWVANAYEERKKKKPIRSKQDQNTAKFASSSTAKGITVYYDVHRNEVDINGKLIKKKDENEPVQIITSTIWKKI